MTELDMADFRAQKKERETERARALDNWKATVVDANTLKKTKWGLSLIIGVVGLFYACKVCFQMYPEAISVFGWPIFVARACGMMAACWTAVLYFTMARSFLTRLQRCTSKRGVMV